MFTLKQISQRRATSKVFQDRRCFSSKDDKKWTANNIAHLPIALQREVFYHLDCLEFKDIQKRNDIELKLVREQYLKLAHKYHPDSNQQGLLSASEQALNE